MPVTFQVVGNLADFGNDPRAGVKVRATASPGVKVGDVAVHSDEPETVVTDEDGAFALTLISVPGVWYTIRTPYSNAINTVRLAGYTPDVEDPTTGDAFAPGVVIDLIDVMDEDPSPGYEGINVSPVIAADGGDPDAAPLPVTLRRGTTAEWTAANPVLAAGEPAVVLDSGQPAELVLGDGVTAMADLRSAVWDDDARLALADTAVQPAAMADAWRAAVMELGAVYAPIRGISSEFAALGAELALAQRSTAVQIIGDSTGNATDEWVHLTAQAMAADYPGYRVEHRIWDGDAQNYQAPLVVQAAAGERHLVCDGVSRPVCVPDSATNSITGDIDLRVDVSLDSWTATGDQVLVSKFNAAGQRTIRFQVSSSAANKPQIEWSADGTTLISAVPTTWTIPAPGGRKWLRATLDVDNGAGGNTTRFYESADGYTWTQIGADVVKAGTTSLFDSTSEWQAGARGGSLAGGLLFNGKLYHVEVRNGISGPLVTPAKPEAWPTQGNSPTYGGAPLLTFVNGSHPGAFMTYLNDSTRFAHMTPDYGQALAIVSCSHNDGASTGAAYLAHWDTMLTNLRAKFPLAGMVASTQNPRTSPAASIREHAIRAAQILGWASRNRVGVIDAYRAFIEDSQDIAALVSAVDGVHPTAAGSQVWSEAAQSALTGR